MIHNIRSAAARMKSLINHPTDDDQDRRSEQKLATAIDGLLSETAFPLPRIVHLETRTRCNGACEFCVASFKTDPRDDQSLRDDMIASVLSNLAEHQFRNRLSFYGNNEPFLDKRIYDIVEQARAKLPEAYLEIKTNGRNLTYEKVLRIFDAGLDMLYINDYADAEAIASKTHRKNVADIIDKLGQSRRFKGHFNGNAYHTRVVITHRLESEVLGSRAGTAPNREITNEPSSRPCYRPVEMVVVTANGNVCLCSEDVLGKAPMGNVAEKPLIDIWRSDAYAAIRKRIAAGNRADLPTCANCDYRGYSSELMNDLTCSDEQGSTF